MGGMLWVGEEEQAEEDWEGTHEGDMVSELAVHSLVA